MEVTVDSVVMPGDFIKFPSDTKEKIILGPGLARDGESVYALKAGILKNPSTGVFYIDSYQRRYIPHRGENVVGVVVQKLGDIYKVDIGSSEPASLSFLAFEGASKRNRPDIQLADVIYAKLLVASKDMEPELVCVDSQGKKGKLGVLGPEGMLLTCSLNLVRKILSPANPFINLFAQEQPFEVAVGMNGRIWINARSIRDTIALANAILAAEYTPMNQMQSLCQSISRIALESC